VIAHVGHPISFGGELRSGHTGQEGSWGRKRDRLDLSATFVVLPSVTDGL
jgi:hypothetical protein